MLNRFALIPVLSLIVLQVSLSAVPNCQIQLSGNCKLCSDGYFLTNANSCVALTPVSNCLVHSADESGNYSCSSCAQGYAPFGGVCQQIAQCRLYDTAQESLKCTRCALGWTLTADGEACLADIDHCQAYSNTSTASDSAASCVTCSSGYQLAFDGTQCLPAISNCSDYVNLSPENSILQCATCASGWVVTNDNLACLHAIDNCSSYTESSISSTFHVCDSCSEGFQKNSSGRLCLASIRNCSAHSDSLSDSTYLICTSCSSTYVATDDQRKCLREISNCQSLQASSYLNNYHTCSSCSANFSLTDDNRKCLNNIGFCSSYFASDNSDDVLTCSACNANYLPTADGLACFATIANCDSYNLAFSTDSNFTCDTCQANYWPAPSRTACLSKISQCQLYSYQGSNSFFNCAICQDGFTASVDTLTCQANIANCSKQTSQLDANGAYVSFCRICMKDYLPSPDSTSCIYSEIDNCIKSRIALIDGVVTAVCEKCAVRYAVLPSGQCTASIPGCWMHDTRLLSDSVTVEVFCKECEKGFFLASNEKCYGRDIKYCTAYSLLITEDGTEVIECLACEQTYFLYNNACLKKNFQNCISYGREINSAGVLVPVCTQCAQGTRLIDSKLACWPEIYPCVRYTTVNNDSLGYFTCQDCGSNDFGLTNDGRKCLRVLANCIEYAESSFLTRSFECKTCNQNSLRLSNGTCVIPLINGCASYAVRQLNSKEEVYCTSCTSPLILHTNGLRCYPEISNCLMYDPTPALAQPVTCTRCNAGFRLSNDRLACNNR